MDEQEEMTSVTQCAVCVELYIGRGYVTKETMGFCCKKKAKVSWEQNPCEHFFSVREATCERKEPE